MKDGFVVQRRFVGHEKRNRSQIIFVCIKYKCQRGLGIEDFDASKVYDEIDNDEDEKVVENEVEETCCNKILCSKLTQITVHVYLVLYNIKFMAVWFMYLNTLFLIL